MGRMTFQALVLAAAAFTVSCKAGDSQPPAGAAPAAAAPTVPTESPAERNRRLVAQRLDEVRAAAPFENLSAGNLAEAYFDNAVAAKGKYYGKTVQLRDELQEIAVSGATLSDTSTVGAPYEAIRLQLSASFMTGDISGRHDWEIWFVICYVPADDEVESQRAAALQKGTFITVRGVVAKQEFDHIFLKYCTIVQ